MRRRLGTALMTILLLTGLGGIVAAPAHAAARVSVPTIADHLVASGGTWTVRPKVVKKKPGTKIISKTVTAKKGGVTVARNKVAIALGVGTYSISTKIHFKARKANGTWGKPKFKMNTQTVAVKPRPVVTRPPTTYRPPATSRYYKNCTEARNAGAAPVYRGSPGYGSHLDRDGDGVGCE